ncbi:MAG TPA: ECF-type sigma factor [Planctomycetaceae bacterium]
MSDNMLFTEFISRIRTGDQRAAAELVTRYEPVIRREIRLQLDDRNLLRAFDSMDICQSVLASFFIRTAAGEYHIESSVQLVHLLVNMARNKLVSAARREFMQRRDLRRRAAPAGIALESVTDQRPTPAEELDQRELLDRIYDRLTPDELRISRLRSGGAAWDEIAGEMGGTAQSRRMQFSRALERVAETFGIDLS